MQIADEQIKKAKETDIISFLQKREIKAVTEKASYALFHCPHRVDRNPSFIVTKDVNKWKDMATGESGDLIDLVKLIHSCDFKEAVGKIIDENVSMTVQDNGKDAEIVIRKILPLTDYSLVFYMQKRGIDKSIYSEHCKEVHYFLKGKNYYAVGFQNDSKEYELRNKYFKGATHKNISTKIKDPSSKDIFLFEGFMDYLSYLTIGKNKNCNAIILNSTSLVNTAINSIKEDNIVHLCLDNDQGGKACAERIKKAIGEERIIDHSDSYAQFNDLNEYLLSQKKNSLKIK